MGQALVCRVVSVNQKIISSAGNFIDSLYRRVLSYVTAEEKELGKGQREHILRSAPAQSM